MGKSQIKNGASPFLFFGQRGKGRCNIEFIENTSIPAEKEEILDYEKTESVEAARFFDSDLKFSLIDPSPKICPVLSFQ